MKGFYWWLDWFGGFWHHKGVSAAHGAKLLLSP